jgi:hypothetical protein
VHFTPTSGETILHASSRPERYPAGCVPDKLRMDTKQRLLYRKKFLIKPYNSILSGKIVVHRDLSRKKFRLNSC